MKFEHEALLDLSINMGALFRIRLLQYWFILSIMVWHLEVWYRVAVPLHYSELTQHIFQLLPSAFTLVVLVFYICWRKTVMFPLLLAASSAWYIVTSAEFNALHTYWFFGWQVMIAFPFFYYKFQDFKLMVSMFRWMLLIGAIGLMALGLNAGNGALGIVMNCLFVLGMLGLFLHYLKSISAVVLIVGATWMIYDASLSESWQILYLYFTHLAAAAILYADPFSKELSPFLWIRYPYFRGTMLVLLLVVVVPLVNWPQEPFYNWIMSFLPAQEINS